MDEAQVVTGIPTLSVDPKTVARPATTVTPTVVAQTVTKTESRSTTAASATNGPSIYRRQTQTLPVGNRLNNLPRWPFWVADGLLLAGALAIWLLAPRPMSLGSIILAALLIILGAALALVPWLTKPGTPPPAAKPAGESGPTAPPLQRLPFRLQ